jgi:Xaa-Pro aminopeptidase
MSQQSLDALLVVSLPNIHYLTNFAGTAAAVLLTSEQLIFVTDSRYMTSVADMQTGPHACPGLEMVVVDASYDQTLVDVLGKRSLTRVGFEASHITVARFTWLDAHLRNSNLLLVPCEELIERVRQRKDGYEIGVLREAGRRLSRVTQEVFTAVRAGRTEQEVALDVEIFIRRGGFERLAFDTIVASGPNSALPHARPTERKLHEGDLVLLDFGGVYDSYCVDLTRTVSVGRASARARQVHQAVLNAHDHALSFASAGRSRFDVDDAARTSLAADGLADAFGHGTGHGLGLEVHELPRISRRRSGAAPETNEILEPGMVFTVEPGAYLPGWGGVRIEDDVLVTDGSPELLTTVTTELLEL